jgi:hypothetical protein
MQLGVVVVKEFRKMRVLVKTSVTAALSLILGIGALSSYAAPVTVVGGNSTTIGGWQISPDPGINLNITGVNSSPALVIQSESATFNNGGPLNVTFKQISADAVATVDLQTAAIANSTGADWSAYTFSLNGSASFESVSDVFVPPVGTGVNYNTVSLNPQTTVKYTGTQLNDAVSTWGGTTSTDQLVISTDPSTNSAVESTFVLDQAPTVNEVRAPLAVWQSLTGLAFVIFITMLRPPKPISIA